MPQRLCLYIFLGVGRVKAMNKFVECVNREKKKEAEKYLTNAFRADSRW